MITGRSKLFIFAFGLAVLVYMAAFIYLTRTPVEVAAVIVGFSVGGWYLVCVGIE